MAGFKSAFRAARAAGSKSFMWNGEKYNTKLATETPAPAPPKRPREASAPASEASAPARETKWVDPGAREGGRPRDEEPAPRKAAEGWADAGAMENEKRDTGSFKRGGMVKKAKGPATIGVTRSNRDYGKKR